MFSKERLSLEVRLKNVMSGLSHLMCTWVSSSRFQDMLSLADGHNKHLIFHLIIMFFSISLLIYLSFKRIIISLVLNISICICSLFVPFFINAHILFALKAPTNLETFLHFLLLITPVNLTLFLFLFWQVLMMILLRTKS